MGLKTIVAGDRTCTDYELVCRAIKESKFDISEIISGKSKGVDALGERWANENDIPVKEFPAKWKALKVKGAVIKENQYGKYNANSGRDRNIKMAEYGEALIAVQLQEGGSVGTNHMVKMAEEKGLKVFIYKAYVQLGDDVYQF